MSNRIYQLMAAQIISLGRAGVLICPTTLIMGGRVVFHQIGNVEAWSGEQEGLQTLKDAGEGPWFTKGYAAVMRVNRSGASEGVYIMFDFYQPDDATGNRYPKYNGPLWGYLGGDKTVQFSCARIADKISDLDLFRPFHLTKIVTHPVKIVCTIVSPQGFMIHGTVV